MGDSVGVSSASEMSERSERGEREGDRRRAGRAANETMREHSHTRQDEDKAKRRSETSSDV